eukprot:TRINITY_DN922_c0_g1_i2.p1 TRINITY_DN922_c0_g1~~TRINITY_DN922_c0_g1_i2.p1  ORF type:complete len:244 (-),score=59.51 TRINITY_DN922_c0_g1_i2:7-738(-)
MSDVPSWLVEGATAVAHRSVDGHNIQQQGIVRYVGLIDGMKGTFVGIELPTADGKNNGSVEGKQYFGPVEPNHGLFIKVASVTRPGELPSSGSSKNAGSSVFDKLTDASQYTGSHKQRFDETGKGKGKEGREDVVKNTGYVQGFDPNKNKAPPKQASGGSIFDKLTDPNQYTGAHKHRFDETGKGKGKEGREDVAKPTGYVQGFDPEKAKAPPKQASGTSIFDKLNDPTQYTCLLYTSPSPRD